MLPVTPATRPARPQRSTSRKSPGHNEGAIEAANRSANPMSARHMAARANRNKQRSLLPDGQCLARSVTKLGLRQSIMKDNDQIQITTLRRVAAASQPHEIPQPQHLATEISPQLDGPTLMGKGESLSSVMHTPIKEAAIPRKPLRVYRNAAKRQALERRDVYQLPEDESNESNQLIEEPMTSNFQDPSNESAPTSPESETLEQCLRRSLHAKQASDEAQSDTSDDTGASVLEGGNDKAVEEDEEDDRILDGQEARNEIADDARSNTSSQSESLSELELEILQLREPSRPSTTPSSSPKRPRPSAPSESPDYHEIQTNKVDDEAEEEEFGTPSPKKRRRNTCIKHVEAARSEALQTLTIWRRSKLASKPRQGNSVVNNSKQPQHSQKQKKTRCLPVDELVTVSQRFDNPNLEEHNGPPLELSQDPISQISDGRSENNDFNINVGNSIKYKIPRARKGIRPIDASKFRFPDPMSPRVQCYILQTPSYSDGFEGKEAEPIGRLMPVKGTIRWKEAQHKMPFRMPQLILVPEKSSSPTKTDIRPRQRKKRQSVVDLQSRPKDPATEKRLCRVQAKQQSQLGNGPQSQPQVEVASIEQQDHRMDFNELPDADQGSNDEPQNDNQMEVAPSIQHHDPMQENGQPELHDESNDYHADPASPDPSTPKRLSSDEGDSKDLPSTSPLKREQQTKHIAKEIKEPAKSTKASNSSNGTKMSQAMSNIASTTKKTKKQAKADFEAMYELSMVSVKRRHLSDDEDESQSEYEEGDTQEEGEDGHEVRDDDGRSGDEGQRPDSDDVNEETESAEEAEGDGPSLNPEQEAETDNDAMCQDDDEPKLLGEDDIDKDTSGEQRDTQNTSLKFMARLVPDQSSRMYRGSDLSGLLQNKNFLGKNRHSQPSGRQNSQHHKSCAPSRWDAHFDSSWRPEVPASNSLEIEVDDEIYDSPTQPLSQARLSGQNYNSRQRSRLASRPLPLAPSRPRSPILENTDQNSQGSVILGNTQNFVLPVSIPETQLSNEGEEPRSQIYEVPSYFSQAIQNLENPNSKHLFSRTKSTPARVHFEQAQTDARLLTASAMFVKTISPVRSTLSQRLPTLREESGTSSQSLHVLTRRASSSMGTRPADSRRRMQPAVYNPPFLNPRGVEGARA